MGWVDEEETKRSEESAKGYLKIVEGDNRFQLLTHCARSAVKWTGSKYEPAEEGDTNISIKGVCWVLQDGVIKKAELPYTATKAIRGLQEKPETSFDEFPMPYAVNLTAKNAGSKEVEYFLIASRKDTPIPEEILKELATKPSPEEMVEKMKEKAVSPAKVTTKNRDYPEMNESNNAESDLPFEL